MLTITNFKANYYIPGGAPDQAVMQARLDRLVHHDLPLTLNGRLRPPPSDEEAVYRIRHLQLDLWIDALAMTDVEISQRWGQLLLHAVTRALLTGSPAEVMRYDNHAHFLAAFLGDLLAGVAWSRWVYQEFKPLAGLPVGRVAAHLLVSRPALLIPVARRLAQQRQLEPLLLQLQPAEVQLIWHSGLGFRPPDRAWLPLEAGLETMLALLREGIALEAGRAGSVRNLLRFYLALSLARPELAGTELAATLCHHLVQLHRLWLARPAPLLWAALAQGEVAGPEALAAMLAGLDDELAAAQVWLKEALSTTTGRLYLARLVPVVTPVERDEIEPQKRLAKGRQFATGFAGLAFCLPAIRELRLHEQLEPEGLYQLLLALVGRTQQPLAWSDPALAWLAGLPEQAQTAARSQSITWPEVGQGADRVELQQVAEQAADHLGSPPGSIVALLVLRRFAAGLRGFDKSSPAYLARQFINLPGYLHFNDKTIDVYLSRAPLGVVLQMVGRAGEQGPIPWLEGRMLNIYLP